MSAGQERLRIPAQIRGERGSSAASRALQGRLSPSIKLFDPQGGLRRLERTVDTSPTNLPLAEMLRIMDVARTLRQEREVAREQFNREEARTLLRERLKASTEITGSQVTEEEIDAAIESYFNNLHTFHNPPWGVQVFLAHLYVRRVQVFVVSLIATLLIAGLWFLAGRGS